MASWSLTIRDPSGKKDCTSCVKADVWCEEFAMSSCLTGALLAKCYSMLVEQSYSADFPINVGWGVIKISCTGYVPKEIHANARPKIPSSSV